VLFAPLSEVEGQSNTEPTIAPAPRTINLTAEQRFIIKQIVYKDLNVPKAQAGAPESIGDPVPPEIALHDMTPELAQKVPEAARRPITPSIGCKADLARTSLIGRS
jgi:hypothetical protein